MDRLKSNLCSEACGTPEAGYVDSDPSNPGACNGCGPQWHSLAGLLKALGGGRELNADCQTSDGGPGACIEADFVASRILPSPENCGK